MDYRLLGRTCLNVSVLGYGASPLGGVFGPVDEAEGTRCVHAALDGGVNLLDVSPFYGNTTAETRLGAALRGVVREGYYLSTKVGRYGDTDFDFSRTRVLRSLDESLARLGTDYVDIILCHDIEFGDLDQIVGETLPALRQAVAQGKARFVGVSGLPLLVLDYVAQQVPLDVVLSYCHYTLSDTSLAEYTPGFAKRGSGVINASPLGMGLFTDSPLPPWHPAPPVLREACARAGDLCRTRGANFADLALSFSVRAPYAACTLVGCDDAKQMLRNIVAIQNPPDPELLEDVRDILRPVWNLSWPSGKPENRTMRKERQAETL